MKDKGKRDKQTTSDLRRNVIDSLYREGMEKDKICRRLISLCLDSDIPKPMIAEIIQDDYSLRKLL